MRKTFYKLLTRALARYFKTPQFLILYLTSECWMKCRHCFYNEAFRKTNNIQEHNFSFDELRLLFGSIKKILYLSLTGGEPFIREDLEDIIKLFTAGKKVFRYQIPTSGYKTSLIIDKTQRILRDNPAVPFRVHVSLDGNKEIQKIIRGRTDAFDNALYTIKELNKLKKYHSHFDVGIITTVCSYNQDILEEMNGIVENIHPNGEWCINFIRGEPRNQNAKNVDLENYSKVSNLIDARIQKGTYQGYSGHITSGWLTAKNAARRKIIYKILKNEYRGGGCSAGSLGGIIYPDGSVYPCEILSESIGNLKDYNYNLQHLWNSAKGDELRDQIQETACVCSHECTLSTNFLIQPRTWPSLVYERIKLLKNN
jgi:radical SAM protein with 4Fe4S-binding SPASM domain